MPSLNPNQIAALNPSSQSTAPVAPQAASFVPSAKDVKRAKERTVYAIELLKSAGCHLAVPATITANAILSLRDEVDLAFDGTRTLKDNAAARLGRMLLIDAHRYLLGAAKAVDVPNADAARAEGSAQVDNDDE